MSDLKSDMCGEAKLLILGGSSFVGRHLFKRLGPGRAIATFNKTPITGGVRFDSLSMRLADIIDDPGDVTEAVILLGDTNPDSCAADPVVSNALNVDSTKRVLDDLAELEIRPIFTSSEFVFDGEKGDYVETDPTEPIMLYGLQKLEIERYLEATATNYCVLRLAKVYGEDLGDGTLLTGFLNTIERETSLRCASDQRFSPVYVGDVCDTILRAAEAGLSGTFHVAGPQGLSRLECLNMIVAALGEHRPVELEIEPCSIHDFALPVPRPLDVSMRPDKLVAATGLELRHLAESCAHVASAYARAA